MTYEVFRYLEARKDGVVSPRTEDAGNELTGGMIRRLAKTFRHYRNVTSHCEHSRSN